MSVQEGKAVIARAAVLREVRSPLILEQIEVGLPRDDEVLVRMAGVGVCAAGYDRCLLRPVTVPRLARRVRHLMQAS